MEYATSVDSEVAVGERLSLWPFVKPTRLSSLQSAPITFPPLHKTSSIIITSLLCLAVLVEVKLLENPVVLSVSFSC